jgi:hypothetical protein
MPEDRIVMRARRGEAVRYEKAAKRAKYVL